MGQVPTRMLSTSPEFLLQVFLPIGLWMLLVLAFFVILAKKYTFGNWTKASPNPYEGETFDMPRGTFRGIITMTLLYVVVILELVTVHTPGYEIDMKEFMVSFQMMIAFYFGSKVMHHVTSTDRAKAEINANSTSSTSSSNSSSSTSTDGGSTNTGGFSSEGSVG